MNKGKQGRSKKKVGEAEREVKKERLGTGKR